MISYRQEYHLEPPCGLMNDPNGLSYFQGKYYVFFQWNRFAKDHSSKEWGWFESEDLVRWTFRGSALVPDQFYDRDGVLSGSAAVGDDGLLLYYTGKVKVNGLRKSHQCVALMRDGRHILKLGPVVGTPAECTEHFRDPSVRRLHSGAFLMVVGGQRAADGFGSIYAYRSTDGHTFTPAGELASSHEFEMIECSELLELRGEHVLLYCLQRRDNATDTCGESFSVYKPVHFDEATMTLKSGEERDLDRGYARLDEGFDFYAPQTIVCPDGRRILFGWMSRMEEPQERMFSHGMPYIHCLTMPRELFLKDGRLIQVPARELCRAMSRTVPVEREEESSAALAERGSCAEGPGALDANGSTGVTAFVAYPHGRAYRAQLDWENAARDPFAIDINGDARLVFDAALASLVLEREALDKTGPERRSVPLGALERLDVWSDTSSVEVFINGGEHVLSARIAPSAAEPRLRMCGALDLARISVTEVENS